MKARGNRRFGGTGCGRSSTMGWPGALGIPGCSIDRACWLDCPVIGQTEGRKWIGPPGRASTAQEQSVEPRRFFFAPPLSLKPVQPAGRGNGHVGGNRSAWQQTSDNINHQPKKERMSKYRNKLVQSWLLRFDWCRIDDKRPRDAERQRQHPDCIPTACGAVKYECRTDRNQ